MKFRPDIEGLRGLAVTSVVLFHSGIGLSGGFVGVDVFFVISGYLITSLLDREIQQTAKIDFLAFYGRRAKRLLPAAVAVIFLTIIVGAIIMSPMEQARAAAAGASASIYVSNFWFLRTTLDYFQPENIRNPFLHTWSLAVEEQFYLIWPLLLTGLALLRRPLGTTWMAVGTAVSFFICLYFSYKNTPVAFYMSFSRGWEFGLGALASRADVRQYLGTQSRAALSWLAMLALVFSFFIVSEEMTFPGFTALWPTIATAVLLGSQCSEIPFGAGKILCSWPVLWAGRVSYSAYLVHWPVLVFAAALFSSSTLVSILCFILSFAIAFLLYEFVEKPTRRADWLLSSHHRMITVGAVLTVLSFGLSAAWWGVTRIELLNPKQQILVATVLTSADETTNCLAAFTQESVLTCTYGVENPTRRLVLFGDSHAAQWIPALQNIAVKNRWKITTLLKSSCSASDVEVYSPRLRRTMIECTRWRRNAIQWIKRYQPDAIILSQFSSNYILQSGKKAPLDREILDWKTGFEHTIRALEGNAKVLVIRDTPTPSSDVVTCLGRVYWRWGGQVVDCAVPRPHGVADVLAQNEASIIRTFPNATYLDATNLYCNAITCPPIVAANVMYRDNNHLSHAGALLATERLESALNMIMPRKTAGG